VHRITIYRMPAVQVTVAGAHARARCGYAAHVPSILHVVTLRCTLPHAPTFPTRGLSILPFSVCLPLPGGGTHTFVTLPLLFVHVRLYTHCRWVDRCVYPLRWVLRCVAGVSVLRARPTCVEYRCLRCHVLVCVVAWVRCRSLLRLPLPALILLPRPSRLLPACVYCRVVFTIVRCSRVRYVLRVLISPLLLPITRTLHRALVRYALFGAIHTSPLSSCHLCLPPTAFTRRCVAAHTAVCACRVLRWLRCWVALPGRFSIVIPFSTFAFSLPFVTVADATLFRCAVPVTLRFVCYGAVTLPLLLRFHFVLHCLRCCRYVTVPLPLPLGDLQFCCSIIYAVHHYTGVYVTAICSDYLRYYRHSIGLACCCIHTALPIRYAFDSHHSLHVGKVMH